MKFTAALLALVAAIAAPLASAQCNAANTLLLGNLTIASKPIKRTSVNGGARIVQTFTVKNAGPNAAVVRLTQDTTLAPATLIKGTAKVAGSRAAPLTQPAGTVTSSTATGITIPAKKTLKATVAWKTPRCVNPSPSTFTVGIPTVHIFSEQSCLKRPSGATATTVRVHR